MGTKQDKEVESKLIQDREKRVAKEPKQSFKERTSSTPPFIKEDGSQNNGAEDIEKED